MPRQKLQDTMTPEEHAAYLEEKRLRKNERERLNRKKAKQKRILEHSDNTDYEQQRNEAMQAALDDFEADHHIEEADSRVRDRARNKADLEARTGGKTPDQILQEVDERVRSIRRDYQDGVELNKAYNRAVSMAEQWAGSMEQPRQEPRPHEIDPYRHGNEKPRPKCDEKPDERPDKERKSDYVVGTYRRIARHLANGYDCGDRIESPNKPQPPVDKSHLEQQFEDWLNMTRNADNVRIDSSIRKWMLEQGFPDNQIDVAMARGESANEVIIQGCRHGSTKHTTAETLEIFQSVLKTAHLLIPYNLSLKTEKRLTEERQKQKRMQYLALLMLPTTVLLTLLSKGILWKVGPTHTSVDLIGMSQTKLQRTASSERTGSRALNEKLLSLYVGDIIDILRDRHVPAIIINNLMNEAYLWDSTRYFVQDDQLVNVVEVKERIALGATRQKPMPYKVSAVMTQVQAQILGSQVGRQIEGYHLPSDGDCFILRFKPIYFDSKTCVWRYDIEEMLDILRHVHREAMRGTLEWMTEVRFNDGTLYIKCDRSRTGYHCQGEALRQSNLSDPTICAKSLALNLYMTRAYVDGCYDMPDAYVLWDLDTNNLREFEQSQYMQLCRKEMQHQQELEVQRAERKRQQYLAKTEQEQQLETLNPETE